jgi:hypothetical protein
MLDEALQNTERFPVPSHRRMAMTAEQASLLELP